MFKFYSFAKLMILLKNYVNNIENHQICVSKLKIVEKYKYSTRKVFAQTGVLTFNLIQAYYFSLKINGSILDRMMPAFVMLDLSFEVVRSPACR